MDGPVLGILLGGLGLSLFLGALRLSRRGRHRSAAALIVAGGLCLRIAAGTDPYLHDWDERYHALVAKNLVRHPLVPTLYDDPVLPYDYRDWSANHVWLHKQPLPLWAMALSIRVFGANEIAVRLPSLLLSALAIALTCAIGAALFTPGVGLMAAALHAVNGLVIQVTAGRVATDHVDLFLLFFVELAVALAVLAARRDRRLLTAALGFVIGLAVLCKWLTALVVIPLWLLLVLGKRSARSIATDLAIIAGVCCATFLPWQFYIHAAFPSEALWEGAFNLRHLTEALEGHGGTWTFHARALPRYGALVALPIAWFLAQSIRSWREVRWTLPAAWFGIPFLFFTFARTKMVAYTLFAAPALFIMSAAFVAALSARVTLRFRAPLAALLLVLVAGPLPELSEALFPAAPATAQRKWSTALKSLGRKIPESNAVFFNAPPVETMFYTSGTAYRHLPTNRQVDELTARGYRVYVVDAGKIPEQFRRDTRATLVAP